MSEKRDIEFLFEIGQLRLIKRMWQRFFQSDIADLSDHIFRVAWIALMIAKREGKVNEEKLLKMALVHDISESRTGDVDYIARQYTKRDEELATSDMLKDTALEEEMCVIWKEYEERESLEAKIVKDADNLDVDLELKEQSIQTVAVDWLGNRKKLVRSKLYTKTAQKYFDAIYKSDMHDWHLKGRNRFNAGDWKEE
jgi:putative hydrolase of HD superfamily